jgi:hypothetical protein
MVSSPTDPCCSTTNGMAQRLGLPSTKANRTPYLLKHRPLNEFGCEPAILPGNGGGQLISPAVTCVCQ